MGRRGDALGLDLWVRLWRVVPVPYRQNRGGVMREGVRWEPEAHFVPYAKSGRADWPEGGQWFRTKADAKAEAASRSPTVQRTRTASGIAAPLADDPEPPRRETLAEENRRLRAEARAFQLAQRQAQEQHG